MDKTILNLPHRGLIRESGFTQACTKDGDFFVNGQPIYGMTLINALSIIMDWKQENQVYERSQECYERPEKREKHQKECDIYFIKDDLSGLTKIGRAKCAKSRLNGMLTANPRIRLLFYYRATEIEELKWHEIFSEKREYREWFRLEVETLESIQNFLLAKSSEQ